LGINPIFRTRFACGQALAVPIEIATKQKDMKKSSAKITSEPGDLLPWKYGAGLQRGTLLLRRLRAAIEGIAGHALTYEELSALTGEPKSTLGNWINGDGQPSPETLLRLLEMLPTSLRNQILEEPAVSRSYPTLEHPRLAHDPVKVSCLKTIISQTKGITLVQGERETPVTFLLTALGHSARILAANRREVLGLDSHAPDWFVPVAGVTYFENVLQLPQLRTAFEKAWPRMRACQGGLLILNGGWAQLPGVHEKIRDCARSCHVVVSDQLRSRSPQANNGLTHVITVAAERVHSDQIRVELQAI